MEKYNDLPLHIKDKDKALRSILQRIPNPCVLYSGGLDSSFLLFVADSIWAENALGLIGISPSLSSSELKGARNFAKGLRARYFEINTQEFNNPKYSRNSGDRCYHCKTSLLEAVIAFTRSEEISNSHIIDGLLSDDPISERPGVAACDEFSVRHPLKEANISKSDVRILAKAYGLAFADKPSSPCLSSRVYIGTEVTPELLKSIEAAEKSLHDKGYRAHRVRAHGMHGHKQYLARIEFTEADYSKLFGIPNLSMYMSQLHAEIIACGFKEVTIDLAPYRSGGANALFLTTDFSSMSELNKDPESRLRIVS